MRGIRQWLSDNGEVAGILIFILIVVLVGGISYGISYAVGGKTGSSKSSTVAASEETASSEETMTPSTEAPSESTETTAPETTGQPSTTTAGNNENTALGETINEYGVYFTIVDEQVTAKIETNLRRVPSTEKAEDVVTTIYNGDWIKRTGIGHNGWSRVEYNGQVLYAVTSYLSTDGSSASEPTYQDVSDNVTAKEECYLRSTPDSANDDNVVATLSAGTVVPRTGIGSNGWSKLNFNGTEVYAVTSLLEVQQ